MDSNPSAGKIDLPDLNRRPTGYELIYVGRVYRGKSQQPRRWNTKPTISLSDQSSNLSMVTVDPELPQRMNIITK